MKLLRGKILRGCNVHHHASVFSQRVDLGRFAGRRSGEAGAEFAARFIHRFALTGRTAEFHADLNRPRGAPFAETLLEAVVAVEQAFARAMGRLDTVDFATIVPRRGSKREVELVWTCHSGSVSRTAARVALAGLLELTPARLASSRVRPRGSFDALLKKMEQRARRRRWSGAMATAALAAKQRGVPYESLAGQYLRLGEGALQRVVAASTAGAALERMFPAGTSAHVPTALILGDRGTTSSAGDLDALLRETGRTVGLATRKATMIAGKPVDPTSVGRGGGARFLLGSPQLEMLVCAAVPARVVERGLRLDHATATAILDPRPDAGGGAYRRAIDVVVAATTGPIVAGADNPHAGRLVAAVGPRRVVLLASGRGKRAVRDHLAAGGLAVVSAGTGPGASLELRSASETIASVGFPGGRRMRQAMFTIALAFGLGLTGVEIARAFEGAAVPRV
jgi:hypothetical protein